MTLDILDLTGACNIDISSDVYKTNTYSPSYHASMAIEIFSM